MVPDRLLFLSIGDKTHSLAFFLFICICFDEGLMLKTPAITPNLAGKKHTISTFVDQNFIYSLLVNAEKTGLFSKLVIRYLSVYELNSSQCCFYNWSDKSVLRESKQFQTMFQVILVCRSDFYQALSQK